MFGEYHPYKNVTLEKLTFGMEIYIAVEEMQRFPEHIGYRIRGYVWSQDAGRKEHFQYPADWWQAFKERWFPEWLLKKYPVRYTHKEFLVKATYPDLVVQNHNPVLRLIETTWTDLPIYPPEQDEPL